MWGKERDVKEDFSCEAVRKRVSVKQECTFVVHWEQAAWWGKRENIRLGGRGGEAGEGPGTSPFPAISSFLLFG